MVYDHGVIAEYKVTVNISAENNPPSLATPIVSPQNACLGSTLTYSLGTFNDIDGDTVTVKNI